METISTFEKLVLPVCFYCNSIAVYKAFIQDSISHKGIDKFLCEKHFKDLGGKKIIKKSSEEKLRIKSSFDKINENQILADFEKRSRDFEIKQSERKTNNLINQMILSSGIPEDEINIFDLLMDKDFIPEYSIPAKTGIYFNIPQIITGNLKENWQNWKKEKFFLFFHPLEENKFVVAKRVYNSFVFKYIINEDDEILVDLK